MSQQATTSGVFIFASIANTASVNLDPVFPGLYNLVISKQTGVTPGDDIVLSLTYNLSLDRQSVVWYAEPLGTPPALVTSVILGPGDPYDIQITYTDGDVLTHRIAAASGAVTLENNTGSGSIQNVTVMQIQNALV
jgi:hypothetical protein